MASYFEQGLGYSCLESGTLFAAPSFVGLATLAGGPWLSDRAISRGLSIRLVRSSCPGSRCSTPRRTAGVIGAFFAIQAIGGIVGPWSMGIAALVLADPVRDRERFLVSR